MSGNRMNGYTNETNVTSMEELLSPTTPTMASSSDITSIYHDNILPRNLSSQLSSDSASSVSMPSSRYERRVPTRQPSFRENKFKGDSVSPVVSDTNFVDDRIRCLESEKLTIMVDHNNLIRDFNKRMQSYLEEIRTLKEVNQTVEQELSDLRDLCCFLDDDRRKCRKLAKAWQKFGRNTVTTLKTEVSAYQQRQTCLEGKNSQLIQENTELRELCFHLDQKVSESEIETTTKYKICPQCSDKTKNNIENSQDVPKDITILENKVQQLEREKDMLHRLLAYGSKNNYEKKRVSFTVPDDGCDSSSTASELDFPPALNLELLTKSNHLQDNLGNSMSSLNMHASEEINDNVGMISPGYEQLSPMSPPSRLTSDLLTLSRERSIQLKNEKLNKQLQKNRECEDETNYIRSTNLPAYEDSVRYLETSRINTNDIDDYANKIVVVTRNEAV